MNVRYLPTNRTKAWKDYLEGIFLRECMDECNEYRAENQSSLNHIPISCPLKGLIVSSFNLNIHM